MTLNLFVGVQECLSLATHWLSDRGDAVPEEYREVYLLLAEQGVLERPVAERLASAAGLPNLIAHRYGTLDWKRLHEIAANDLDDLLSFGAALARAAESATGPGGSS